MKRQRATLPKDFDTQLIKLHADRNKQAAIEVITKVEPKLHFVKFSGDFDYSWMEEKIGKMKISDKPPSIMPMYQKEAYIQLKGGYLTVFFWPKKSYLPPCMIQTAASRKAFLTPIAQSLPDMNLSMVEYAVDIYCQHNIGASLLFWILKRYVYVPYEGKSMLYGGQEVDGSNMSFVCRIGPVKFYQRGEDEDKIEIPDTNKRGWHEEKLNRVRIEYTAEGNILQQKGLNTLEDLLKAPKFQEIFSKKVKFKKFLDAAGRFPHYWEGYSAEDLQGNSGAFHDEYVKTYKAGVKNLSQYIEDDDTLIQLNGRIQAEISKFDLDWSNPPG